MRPLPFREVKRKLEAAGFAEAGQTGSHLKFVRNTAAGMRTAIVPKHAEVAAGTIRSILRQAGRLPKNSMHCEAFQVGGIRLVEHRIEIAAALRR